MKFDYGTGLVASKYRLNSNIGCFEMLNPKRQTSDCRMLNSNIGCFEMMQNLELPLIMIWLNSNIGCFEMKLTTM